jgi:phosphoglycerate kinase
MELRTIEGNKLKGKKVLARVDFNVPMDEGRVADDTRLRAHMETLELLRRSGARIALVSHLGRPRGKVSAGLSLLPVARSLEELTGWRIGFCEECVGDKVSATIGSMGEGQICLLENVRFHPEEEANDPVFARKLGEPFDVFVMDAFSAAHRSHASTEGVTRFLPSLAGKLMEKEVKVLSAVMENPKRPMVLILGGAKVSDKIGFIRNMLEKANVMLIGGAMAFPFLKASGMDVGKSFCEEGTETVASEIIETARMTGVRILLPLDLVGSTSLENDPKQIVVRSDAIPEDMMGLDIGPETAEMFSAEVLKAETILWNGPLGLFERDPFGEGTKRVGLSVVERTSAGAVSVLGGGDTAAAANLLGFSKGIYHISTGGGATLEFFEGKELPGITPLLACPKSGSGVEPL